LTSYDIRNWACIHGIKDSNIHYNPRPENNPEKPLVTLTYDGIFITYQFYAALGSLFCFLVGIGFAVDHATQKKNEIVKNTKQNVLKMD